MGAADPLAMGSLGDALSEAGSTLDLQSQTPSGRQSAALQRVRVRELRSTIGYAMVPVHGSFAACGDMVAREVAALNTVTVASEPRPHRADILSASRHAPPFPSAIVPAASDPSGLLSCSSADNPICSG